MYVTAEPKATHGYKWCKTSVLAEMLEAKVSWLLCFGRLVSKIDNVMHFARLVKQASVDYWHSFTTGQSIWHTVLRHLFTLWALHGASSNAGWDRQILCGFAWSQWWLQADPFPNSGPARADQCLDVPRIGWVPCGPHMWSRGLDQFFWGCVTTEPKATHHYEWCKTPVLAEMLDAKVSRLLCFGRLVSKIDNVMHFARLVKQASVDYWRSFTTGQSVWHTVLRHLFTLWALHVRGR